MAENEKKSLESDTSKPEKSRVKLPYPDWWKTAYPRSSVSSLLDQFAGDQPLFPQCPNFDASPKNKRFGPLEPPNYMDNSRNPCWFEWSGKKDILKCLPFFYIVGAPKSATADLYNRLKGHPNVMPGGSTAYYWWDRSRYGASKTPKYTKEGRRTEDLVQLKEYTKTLISNHGKNITKQLLYHGRSESIFGDATPTYLVENTQWDILQGNEGCSEPRVIPATFIRHIFPKARVIILLRNPIDRLYSRFLANVPYVEEYVNHTASLFHTFTLQAVQNYRQCFSKSSIRHCAYNSTLFSNAVIRLSEGMYPVFLEDWFRIFDREQILILKFEEYVKDTQGHLRQVMEHLGLGPLDEYNMQKLADLPLVRKGKVREEEGFMLPETVSLLTEFYAPFNLKLADLLDDEKWLFEGEQVVQAVAAAPAPVNVDTEEENNDILPKDVEPKPEDTEEENIDDVLAKMDLPDGMILDQQEGLAEDIPKESQETPDENLEESPEADDAIHDV